MSQYIDNTTNRMPNESQILKLRNCQYIYNLVAKIYNIRKLSGKKQSSYPVATILLPVAEFNIRWLNIHTI